VESVLSQHPNVGQAVVAARREKSSEASLVAYVVSASGAEEADAGQLREFLRTKLPEYMIPSAFVSLASFPMTPNGKVDRKALPALSNDQLAVKAEYVAPRTAEEEAIAKICAEALNIERVGMHDNFFDLGGNSLVATRLVFQLQEHFQVKLPLVRLFESPTVAGLAAAIADAKTSPATEGHLFDAISLDELKSEVMLDVSIRANGSTFTPAENWKHVFLTGGTGFLGAYLLKGLLSKDDVTVHCLVRARG
jgi:acyl carrier protein